MFVQRQKNGHDVCGWIFCIEKELNNFLEFKTDHELNACHKPVFQFICRQIYNALHKRAKSFNNV